MPTNLENIELQVFSPLSNKKTALASLKVSAELTSFKGSLELRSKNLQLIEEKNYLISDFINLQGPVQKISVVDIDNPNYTLSSPSNIQSLKSSIVLKERIEFEKNFFEPTQSRVLLDSTDDTSNTSETGDSSDRLRILS